MKVLVVYVSRHGATAGIAGAISAALRESGVDTEVHSADEVTALAGYDAAVVGSAMYMGQWLKPAREFAERHQAELSTMPLWLFSSGPIGDPPFPPDESTAVAKLAGALKARGHRTFAGKLDRDLLGRVEELMTMALRAPEGDFRDWTAIREWGDSIAAELSALPSTARGEHA